MSRGMKLFMLIEWIVLILFLALMYWLDQKFRTEVNEFF